MRKILFALTALLIGCVGEETMTGPLAVIPVEYVILPGYGTVERANSVQLEVVLLDAAHHVLESRNITFTSQDKRIATVDERGLVTGVAEGQTTITASVEGRTAQMTLVVLPALTCGSLNIWDYC